MSPLSIILLIIFLFSVSLVGSLAALFIWEQGVQARRTECIKDIIQLLNEHENPLTLQVNVKELLN